MKTNKEKLNDAVGMLDSETVQNAMTCAADLKASRLTRRTTLRRRAVIVLAACLSLTLMLGALFAIPLMTADDPSIPGTVSPGGETSNSSAMGENPDTFYTEVPMVQLTQLTARNDSTVSESPMISRNTQPQIDPIYGFIRPFIIMSFHCEEGETVTVNAGVDSLHLVSLSYTADTDLSITGMFMDQLIDINDANDSGSRTLTIDPATSCILVDMPLTRTDLDEDTMSFTIATQDGKTVGAGSVYLGTRYLLDADVHTLWYEGCTLTRSAVLGSVRFNTPEEVTAEKVSELLDSFAAKTGEVKATLDYSPVNLDERASVAMAEIALTAFAGEHILRTSCSMTRSYDFRIMYIHETDKSETDRAFLIFADGTWGEFCVHNNCVTSQCHGDGCPMGENGDSHHALMPGCHITLLDGRVFEIQEQEIDGIMMYVPVLISDFTA